MPFTITDDMLKSAGLSVEEAKLEIACLLYEAGKLSLPEASPWAAVNRTTFETALLARGLPLVRVGEAYWQAEMHNMQRLGWQ